MIVRFSLSRYFFSFFRNVLQTETEGKKQHKITEKNKINFVFVFNFPSGEKKNIVYHVYALKATNNV